MSKAAPTMTTTAVATTKRMGVDMWAVLHGIRRSRSCGVVRTARRTASIVAAEVLSDPASMNSRVARSKA